MKHAAIAQLAEQPLCMGEVGGSIPPGGSIPTTLEKTMTESRKTTTESELRALAKTMTQKQIAEKTGVKPGYIAGAMAAMGIQSAGLMGRRREVDMAKVRRMQSIDMTADEICKALGISVATLYVRFKAEKSPAAAAAMVRESPGVNIDAVHQH